MDSTRARRWHLLTAVVAIVALVLQAALVVSGAAVLAESDPPGLAVRLGRLVSYFTIQSNLLVAVTAVTLARDAGRNGNRWRVVRLDALIGITVTGLVHWFLLRPLLDLDGANWLADKLLHVAVPLLAVAGWAAFGPRPRISGRVVAAALLWPLAWLAWTLVVGGLTGWYPYPFLDVGEHGYGAVLATSAAVTALFLALCAGALYVDRRAGTRPAAVPDRVDEVTP